MRAKAILSILALVVLAIIAPVSAQAAPREASAAPAYPKCNLAEWQWDGIKHRWVFLPVFNPPDGDLDCVLKKGDFNNFGVYALQNMLKICYGQPIATDADFGDDTEDALIAAQTWEVYVNGKKLKIDGQYGPETRGSVMWPYYFSKADGTAGALDRCRY